MKGLNIAVATTGSVPRKRDNPADHAKLSNARRQNCTERMALSDWCEVLISSDVFYDTFDVLVLEPPRKQEHQERALSSLESIPIGGLRMESSPEAQLITAR
jgi:hypothetical protein